jgi:hypothetical protein
MGPAPSSGGLGKIREVGPNGRYIIAGCRRNDRCLMNRHEGVRHPLQKTPQISPIFISDKVTLPVSREKDGNRAWSTPDGTITWSFSRTGCGQARRRWKGESYPLAGGSDDPPSKTRTPLRPPPGFSSHRCRSRASNRAFFALVFDVPSPVTSPPPLCVTGPYGPTPAPVPHRVPASLIQESRTPLPATAYRAPRHEGTHPIAGL